MSIYTFALMDLRERKSVDLQDTLFNPSHHFEEIYRDELLIHHYFPLVHDVLTFQTHELIPTQVGSDPSLPYFEWINSKVMGMNPSPILSMDWFHLIGIGSFCFSFNHKMHNLIIFFSSSSTINHNFHG